VDVVVAVAVAVVVVVVEVVAWLRRFIIMRARERVAPSRQSEDYVARQFKAIAMHIDTCV
jgi:hypothetical protein